jgi:hypothetical protein
VYRDRREQTKVKADRASFALIHYEEIVREQRGSASLSFVAYAKDKTQVYHISLNGIKTIPTADLETFVPMGEYAKDKHHVFHHGKLDNEMDYNSLTRDGLIYYDKNGVDTGEGGILKIREFDLSRFMALEYHYYTYGNDLYHYDNKKFMKIEGADAKTFRVLDDHYAKDKSRVYYDGSKILEGADAETFVILDGHYKNRYTKDKNRVYFNDSVLPDVDAPSFAVANPSYSSAFTKDKNTIYINNKKVENSDPGTFEHMETYYFRDKNTVYFSYGNDIRIIDADSATFIPLGNDYAKDKSRVFYRHFKLLKGADASTFSPIDTEYSRDKDHVYYNGDVVQGADADSFTVIRPYLFYKDRHSIFVRGEKIRNSDPATFEEVTNYYWYKDKNIVYHLYYDKNEQQDAICVFNADAKTFRKIDDNHVADKNGIYDKGGNIFKRPKLLP